MPSLQKATPLTLEKATPLTFEKGQPPYLCKRPSPGPSKGPPPSFRKGHPPTLYLAVPLCSEAQSYDSNMVMHHSRHFYSVVTQTASLFPRDSCSVLQRGLPYLAFALLPCTGGCSLLVPHRAYSCPAYLLWPPRWSPPEQPTVATQHLVSLTPFPWSVLPCVSCSVLASLAVTLLRCSVASQPVWCPCTVAALCVRPQWLFMSSTLHADLRL